METAEQIYQELIAKVRKSGTERETLALMSIAAREAAKFKDERLDKGYAFLSQNAEQPGWMEDRCIVLFVEKPGIAKEPALKVYTLDELEFELSLSPHAVMLINRIASGRYFNEKMLEVRLAAYRVRVERFVGHPTATHAIYYGGEDGTRKGSFLRLVRIEGGAA